MKRVNLFLVLLLLSLVSCKKEKFEELDTRQELYLKNKTNNYYTVIWGCSYDILPSELYDPTNANEIPPVMNRALNPNDSFNLCDFLYKNNKVYIHDINYLNYLVLYKSNHVYIGFYKGYDNDSIYNYNISLFNLNNWIEKEKYVFQEKDKDGNSTLYNSTPYVFCIDSINILNRSKIKN